jgi:hypothetical protein
MIHDLPLELDFDNKRNNVVQKVGQPDRTTEGDFLGNPFLIDHYKIQDTVVSVDYNTSDLSIRLIQIRDNNVVKHLKI